MSTALLGPYELNFESVAEALPIAHCGVYALGHVDFAGTFRIQKIGRDDSDLRRHLQELIGSSNRFKYARTITPQKAFEIECELFHRFRPPGNIIHPTRPKASDWRCPICSPQGY